MAQAALEAGDTATAIQYASELLHKNTDQTSWNYGNVIYEANQILGLAALREGNVVLAKEHLVAAGETPGSPQLDSFGPDLKLARALLKQGERQAVLQHLDAIATFCASDPDEVGRGNAALIAKWKADIQAGRIPSLDFNEDN